MRRRLFDNKEKYFESTTKFGDILLCEKTTQKLLIVDGGKIDNYSESLYNAIGVVVVPGSHNVYGDGSCAVMSLKEMSCSTPDTGGNANMYFGGNNVLVENLKHYDVGCYVGYKTQELSDTIIGVKDVVTPPSTFLTDFDAIQDVYFVNPFDGMNIYVIKKSSSFDYRNYFAPSPFKTDGTRNFEYSRTTDPSTEGNYLSDFDGKNNTKKLINLANGQSDWKTASSITDDSGYGYYPAACCCWRYHTEGTKQGDWYLPSMGELGYVRARGTTLKDILENLNKRFDVYVYISIEIYHSSTQLTNGNFIIMPIDVREIMSTSNSIQYPSRAFMRLKSNEDGGYGYVSVV